MAMFLCLWSGAGGLQSAFAADTAKEASLTVANRSIVTFRVAFNGADPAGRVARALARMEAAEERGLREAVVLVPVVVEGQRAVGLRVADLVLFHVAEGDLDSGAGQGLDEVARAARDRLADALHAQAEQRRWPVLLRGFGLSLLASLVLALALWTVWRATAWITNRFEQPAAPARRGSFLAYASSVLERLCQLAGLFISAGLVFAWLDFVLWMFPGTQPIAERMGGVVTNAAGRVLQGAVEAIPGLIVVVVILFLAQSLSEASNAIFRAIARRQLTIPRIHPETASATRRLVTMCIWAFALVAAYPYLPGSNSDVFKGISVLIGAMVTLGSTGIVNQLMSGLVLVYSRALRVGDYVVVGEQEGVVSEIGTLATKIVTMRNEEITIPNAVLVGNPIRNYSKLSEAQGTMISTKVTIGYDAPWRQVHELLLAAAAATAGIREKPAPFVLQRSLSDFYVEYELFVNVDKPIERPHVLSVLHGHIQDGFAAAGVQIMSPHFMDQPAAPVLPPRAG